ncbi:GTP-binding protein TypA/BipA [Planctomycetes bacterium Pan216]|uniref:Large ribosomal subunit assembly factor BipA n=1 Tax=Kolteria novifilia TaxID=2527975 RepID=A0A518B6W8_9BACT|nr:GTP-binding protein TypA/BipA [Planctomycetes bacterium Pan216]
MIRNDIRNVAIIAHVDHGKTTLVDAMLRQSGHFRESQLQGSCILDSNDLERERGITILAKNIAIDYREVKINLIDTPGHADFGGEVERTIKMASGCLLLVDAYDGPMPQTRFVLRKAFEAGLHPIVVINKVDRPDGRPAKVLELVYDLFIDLGADDEQIDFPVLYASGKEGWASHSLEEKGTTIEPVFEMIVNRIPGPNVRPEDPLQMQVTSLEWSEYIGKIAVGRLEAGSVKVGEKVTVIKDGKSLNKTVEKIFLFDKLGKVEAESASAGDIAALTGIAEADIGDTIACAEKPEALGRIQVEEPTLTMLFTINHSPLAGKDGQFVTSRNLRERLYRELDCNVALRVEEGASKEEFLVSGRGLLHLGILIENMRREGYELSVGKPHVIVKEIDGKKYEPIESLNVDVPSDKVGPVMELVGGRRGELVEMDTVGERTQIDFTIPSRGLIGLRTRLLNATAGEAIVHHVVADFEPMRGEVPRRPNGVMISNISGRAVAFALDGLQERGTMFVKPGDDVYPGMIVAENCRDNDLVVNPCKEKKLTNMRAAGSDKNILLAPPRDMPLELALEYIEEDELVEVTPKVIRLRKKLLTEEDRRRAGRASKREAG